MSERPVVTEHETKSVSQETTRPGGGLIQGLLIGDGGDCGGIIDRIDRDDKSLCDGAVAIADLHRDHGSAGLVGSRGEGEGAAGTTAAKNDTAIGNQGRVGRTCRQGQAAGRCLHIGDGESQQVGGGVFIDYLVSNSRDRG